MVSARAVAERVTDPELPMVTLAELGVLRAVSESGGQVTVDITPTYSGCPAMDTMRDDLVYALTDAGYRDVEVRTVLRPAWTSDWITSGGKEKLAAAGIAPPTAARRTGGAIPLTLTAPRRAIRCPHCGSRDTTTVSEFSGTACKALLRCRDCAEPFEYFKEF